MPFFCTLFDQNYLSRGLALHQSLRNHCPAVHLVVLCLDDSTSRVLQALELPDVTLVSMRDLERWDPELGAVRPGRSAVEYYFTCKPVLMKFSADRFPTADRITYLDSDLFYFSDPRPGEQAISGNPVALTPHRFPPRLAGRERFGRFNAGWVSARRGGQGAIFLDWWRERCLEWCKLDLQDGKFGDQKYLDAVPGLFPDAAIVENPGANLAPWNLEGTEIELANGRVTADAEPLVFFHFHGLRRMIGRLYDSGLHGYGLPLRKKVRANIYRPYLAGLAAAESMIERSGALPHRPASRGPEYSPDNPMRFIRHIAAIAASRTWILSP